MIRADQTRIHPQLWRATELAAVEVASVPTGYASLDAELPGGGWPRAALSELICQQPGVGEMRLLTPALAQLSRQSRWVVLIAPPFMPYAPALVQQHIDLAQVVLVRPQSNSDALWAAELALRSGTASAVIAWLPALEFAPARRLQLAAKDGQTLALHILQRPVKNYTSPAALRLAVAAAQDRIEVRILKRRGAALAQPLLLTPLSGQSQQLCPTPALVPILQRISAPH